MSINVEFTIGDVIDAIEKNGLPKLKSSFFSYNGFPNEAAWESSHLPNWWNTDARNLKLKVGAACALGQAAINLGVTTSDYWRADTFSITAAYIINKIIKLNDDTDMSLKEIAATVRELYSNDLTSVITAESFDWSQYLEEVPA